MKRSSLATLATLVLLALVSASVWIHRIHIDHPDKLGLITSDTYRYFYPTALYLHEQLQQGKIPLWNPYQMAGQPFMALHLPGVFYPPNTILMGLLTPVYSLGAHAIFHIFIAGFFSWLLAARMGLGPLGRLCAAFVYMLSGSLLLGFYMTPFLSTPAWLPAIWWALTGLLQEARARWALGLAVFVALAFLGGHIQALLYILQVSLLYAGVGLIFLTPRGLRLRVVAWAGIAAVVAFGLVAPQLLPSIELTSQAVRGFDGVPLHQAYYPFVATWELEKGLLHGLMRALPQAGAGPLNPLVTFPVIGVPLVLCGLFAARQRFYFISFLGLAVLVGFFIVGPNSSLFTFYYQLPFGNLFRGPSRMSFIYVLLIGLLMGIGLESLKRGLTRTPLHRALPWVVCGSLLLFVLVDTYDRSDAPSSHPVLTGPIRGAPDQLLEILNNDPGRQRAFVQGTTFYSVGLLFKFGMMNQVFAVPDYEPSMPGVYAEYFSVPDAPPWHGQLHVLSSGPQAYIAPLRLLDLMSVRYYTMLRSGKPDLRRDLVSRVAGRSEIFPSFDLVRRRQSLPRVYAVSRVVFEPDTRSAVARLKSESFQPHREVVVVDPNPEDSNALSLFAEAPSRRLQAKAEITQYSEEEVSISATCERTCLLVLTDLFYPGWNAYVDGEERTVHRVNALFRGVELQPGAHQIVYRYEPISFRLGLACFALTGLGLAGGAVYLRRRRMAPPREAAR